MGADKRATGRLLLWTGAVLVGGVAAGLLWHLLARALPLPALPAVLVGALLAFAVSWLTVRLRPTGSLVLLTLAGALAGAAAADTRQAADYLHFRGTVYAGLPDSLRAPLEGAGFAPGRAVDDMLSRRTGAPGWPGYVRWRARTAFPRLPLPRAGARLLALWLVEGLLVTGLAGLTAWGAGRSEKRQ